MDVADRLQFVTLARESDIVLQVGRLERQFARLHQKFLEQGRQRQHEDGIGRDEGAGAQQQPAQTRTENIQCQKRAGQQGEDDHDLERVLCYPIGGESGAIDDAHRRIDQFIVIEAQPECPISHQDEQQNGDMRRRLAVRCGFLALPLGEEIGIGVDRTHRDQGHGRQQHQTGL